MDIKAFLAHVTESALQNGYQSENLGITGDFYLPFIRPREQHSGVKLLIAAGFHGDEPAGCYAIQRFITSISPELSKKINLSFLPAVNPTGLSLHQRFNTLNEDTNRNFCHQMTRATRLSREGSILLNHIDVLKDCAQNGFLSLHEDIEEKYFYLYSFENSQEPGALTIKLRDTGASFFNTLTNQSVDGVFPHNGILFHHCDGSFEDFLHHQGIPFTSATETPGLCNLQKRVDACFSLIDTFVNFFAGE